MQEIEPFLEEFPLSCLYILKVFQWITCCFAALLFCFSSASPIKIKVDACALLLCFSSFYSLLNKKKESAFISLKGLLLLLLCFFAFLEILKTKTVLFSFALVFL